jgi:hypothetical protein
MTTEPYDNELDPARKVFWDNIMAELHKVSTRTKIRAIVSEDFGKRVLAVEEKTQEHDGILETFKRGVLQIAGGIGKKK